jgi:hypothetical protein
MNSKLAILLSLVLASGTALAGGESNRSTSDQAAMDQGVTGGTADQGTMSGSDQSSDQGVSGSTQQPSEQSFAQVDTNADGLISEDEAQGSQPLADSFGQADTNGDGYVNQSEYNSMLGEQTLQE